MHSYLIITAPLQEHTHCVKFNDTLFFQFVVMKALMVLTVQVSKHPSTFISLLPLPNLHSITNNNVCDEETRGEQ